jgi:hypothetical protein
MSIVLGHDRDPGREQEDPFWAILSARTRVSGGLEGGARRHPVPGSGYRAYSGPHGGAYCAGG